MDAQKHQLKPEEEALQSCEWLCRSIFDDHLKQMKQIQDLLVSEAKRHIKLKRQRAEVDLGTKQQQMEG